MASVLLAPPKVAVGGSSPPCILWCRRPGRCGPPPLAALRPSARAPRARMASAAPPPPTPRLMAVVLALKLT